MKYLIFPELNKNHFLFLSYFIISTIEELIHYFYKSTNDIIGTFHQYYVYSLSDFLAIIPFIIIKIRSRSISKKEISKNNENSIQYIYNNTFEITAIKSSKRIIKIELLMSIFEFMALYSNVLFNALIAKKNFVITKTNLNSVLIINVISKYLLSILVLHSPFSRHHYLSFFINIIFLIILGVLDMIEIYKESENLTISYLYIVMKIINIIFYSFEDVYAKILLSYNSISPYILLLFRAVYVNTFAALFSLIFIYVELPDENNNNSCVFTRLWKIYDNKINIVYIVGMFIIEFLWNVNIFFIIDKFSVSHFAIASIIESFGSLFSSLFIYQTVDVSEFFIRFFIYLILIIASLIHNEFIIINWCGFQSRTQLFLEKEADKDIKATFENKKNTEKECELTIILSPPDNLEECEDG